MKRALVSPLHWPLCHIVPAPWVFLCSAFLEGVVPSEVVVPSQLISALALKPSSVSPSVVYREQRKIFVMFLGSFSNSLNILGTLIAPIGNICHQTHMEEFCLFIKPFYFLSTFFLFLFSQAVPGEEPPSGPSGDESAGAATPAWELSEKLPRNKAWIWFSSQAPAHHSNFSHVYSHLKTFKI